MAGGRQSFAAATFARGSQFRIFASVVVLAFLAGCASSTTSATHKTSKYNDSSYKGTTLTGRDAPESPATRLPSVNALTKSQLALPNQIQTAQTMVMVQTVSSNGVITIQPDCLVQIKVKDDPALDGNYSVNEIGAVELGYVGPVILDNMTDALAAHKIKEVLDARYFRDATVEVRISRASYDKVQVGGAVNKPGLIRIGAGDTISLNDALLRAGGLKPSAKGATVRIVRGGLLSAVAATLKGEEYPLVPGDGQPSVPTVFLRNNDMAYVFSSDAEASVDVGEKEILVLGEVSRPGIYRFSMLEPCTMMHLILKMNGLPEYAKKNAVRVIRKNKDGGEEEFTVDVEKILEEGDPEKNFSLENGDRVIVPARRLSIFN